MKIYYYNTFIKSYQKLPNIIKTKFESKEPIFLKNPFDPRLKTHPLTGKLKGIYSFSIDLHYRVVFSFESEDEIYFHNIGTHQIYR